MTNAAEAQGAINLSQGVCDLDLPIGLAEAAHNAMRQGQNSYTHHAGIPGLREAIALKARNFNGIACCAEQVTVTGGTTAAFYCACLALLTRGDSVVVFEPFYAYHVNTLRSLDVQPIFLPLSLPDFTVDFERLRKACRNAKAILLNTPANPSGKVFTEAELLEIGRICEEEDCLVFTDEIYEHFVYDECPHVSPGRIPVLASRTITTSGFSKVFSITGWRQGYCIAPSTRISDTIGHMSDLIFVCAPSPFQHAVEHLLRTIPHDFYFKLSRSYRAKRDRLVCALNKAGLTCSAPSGAYYILADATNLPGTSSKDKAMWLLTEIGVAAVPGMAFYSQEDPSLLRFCFAIDDPVIDEACRRLQKL